MKNASNIARRYLSFTLALTAAMLALPARAQTLTIVCTGGVQNGNCTLDDIVKTGANFANMLVEISAALFFATFIYGGAMYLMSGGRQDWVKKGTDALKGSALGMLIVMGAWTIVRYVASALTGKS